MDESVHFVGPVERLMYLRTLPLFGNLPAHELAILARFAEERPFRRGDVLFDEGRRVDAIHILVEGSARVSRQGRPFRQFGPRDAVGVMGLLARTTEGVRAVALEDGVALAIRGSVLFRIFEEQFSIYHHILRGTARLLLSERAQLGGVTAADAEQMHREGSGDLDIVDHMEVIGRALPFWKSTLALAQLARGVSEQRFEPGQCAWKLGDPAGWIMLPVAGTVTCRAEVGMATHAGAGVALGLVEALAERRHWCSVTAEEALTVIRLEHETLLDVLEDHFDVAADCLAAMAADVLELFERRAATEDDLPSGLRPAALEEARPMSEFPSGALLRG